MKSTTQAPEVASTTTEYVKMFGDTRQVWNIKCSSAAAADVASAAIEDYYDEEYTALPQVPGAPLDKARPRHHALVAAALRSSLTLTERDFPKSSTTTTTTRTATTTTAAAVSSVYQKHHLVTLSAMCGLLVTRLLITGHSRSSDHVAPHHLWRPLKRHARFTTHYIHSALASEILIGNRYYRSIPLCSALTGPIGNTHQHYASADISPEFVSATKHELCAVYASGIARLTDTVQQFKRGFVNLDTIQSDPQFKRMFSLFWLYCNQVMKIQSEFEKCRLQQEAVVGGDRLTLFYAALDKFKERKDVKRLLIVSDVSEIPAMVPRLYDYDIVHLFDWSKQSYARYVRTVKTTLVRLANDGLTSAFLSFAAIEPRMVTPEMAPKHGMLYQTLSLKSCANHVPSRHPVYGALRVQHSAHIPRTADAAAVDSNMVRRDSDRRRPRTYRYVPVHTTMTEIRNNSIQSMAMDELSAGEKKRALVSK